jgi:hypothetical protein
MRHGDFAIGKEFMTDTGRWRCTDIGTRTIVAIKISEVHVTHLADDGNTTSEVVRSDPSWFNGPPYAVAESVFDEDFIVDCWAV